MQTTVQKWGNSNAVRIPVSILETVSIFENDQVEIATIEDTITIKKVNKRRRPKINLDELLEQYYGKPIDEILADDTLYRPEEYDWGKPMGREVW